ncbi:DUF397 domain-containing protein [Streptomyces bacillaris]|uniref:DUF397 domain-containing protein n=3 Tax=Streptomyces TaxID=1883 RepID=A0AAD0VHP6_9ACTN|nr:MULTISPECIES: DUF397 domain-containing protein [Streptomyces]NUW19089.1 DUF397 domain-containing protein [Streptomyces roseoviolaceus]QCW80138.1 DUF397 domain-containing protein [Streptomyces sp. S6]ALC26229.1 transcriptional regulator [Streptomyces sp. CFMR 7]AXI75139.1 DUF397 domain-containing protein [Streptomyces cavourensis]MBH0243555.1 DUF397 domain-containing protein [Streptomyces cavourensis]
MYKNGVSADSIQGVTWVKSSLSDGIGGNCVEIAKLGEGHVALRNSRDASGPALVYTPGEWEAFVQGAKNGEFDGMTV